MKKNLFGTDGIRGPVGTHPFTPDALPELGKAIGSWIATKYGPQASVLVAHDTRESCSWIKTALGSGMLLYPINLNDAAVLPTPAVLCLLQKKFPTFSCGIIISASHNHYHDNGIKIVDAKTGKISELDEIAITQLFYGDGVAESNFGSYHALANAAGQYVQLVSTLFPQHFLHGKKIVLDCAHGATSLVAPAIFERYGATVTAINNRPNGTNINDACGALHTEQLKKTVIDLKADAGFAFDGDGDRVIAVNSAGEIKNGDDILALLSEHPRYQHQSTIVGTVMANQGFELFLRARHKKLVRTNVGDKYVAHELSTKNLLLGGEQSGHIIIGDYLATGDGIVAALATLESLLATGNNGMATFTKYPQLLLNITVPHKKDLALSPLREIIEEAQTQLPAGRFLIRYSGTEPLLRIMVEAETAESAHNAATRLSEQLSHALAV